MSRGHGRTQRECLRALREYEVSGEQEVRFWPPKSPGLTAGELVQEISNRSPLDPSLKPSVRFVGTMASGLRFTDEECAQSRRFHSSCQSVRCALWKLWHERLVEYPESWRGKLLWRIAGMPPR